jgi:glyoxylase-like metal-dependent hydrolase (beta-lactamase superfamily II)
VALLDEVVKLTNQPITTVILTHSDGDHVNGLTAFTKGITIIGHERAFAANREQPRRRSDAAASRTAA